MSTKTRAREQSWATLTEKFEGGGKPTIDRTANVVRGMKIAAWKSVNGRDYTEALKGNAKLYEGAPVSLNHPPQGGVPTVESRFGVYRNISEQADGIYGDLHYNPKHTAAEQVLWAVEHQPETMANSHRVEAATRKGKSGLLEVQKILKVRGVEIVSEGGMNRTLFEAMSPPTPEQATGGAPASDDETGTPSEDPAAKPKDDADSPAMTACIARVMAVGKDADAARAICSAAMASEKKPDDGEKPEGEANTDEPKTEALMGNKTLAELSESDLRAARPDVFAKADADAAELKMLREAKQKADADAARAAVLAGRRKLCEDAKLPKTAITDVFVEALAAVSDDAAKKLIEERRAAIPGPGASSASRATVAGAPKSEGGEKLTGKMLVEALRG